MTQRRGRWLRAKGSVTFVVICIVAAVVWPARGAASSHIASALADGNQPYWAQTSADSARLGHRAFGQRSHDVQAVMLSMYNNDGRYADLSARFVDEAPGDVQGSAWITIARSGKVDLAAFANEGGYGAPYEEVEGRGDRFYVYAPSQDIYTVLRRVQVPLPPLATVPLSVMPLVSSYSSLQGILSGPSAWLANMLIHPAVFVTSPFFTEKTVTIDGTQVWSGRRVWLLDGIANPLAAPDPTLGNRWRAWVDTNTGIVLRLEYYSGNDLLGSAELREITIDGTGSQRRYTFAAIPPVGARSVSVFEYEQSFKPLN